MGKKLRRAGLLVVLSMVMLAGGILIGEGNQLPDAERAVPMVIGGVLIVATFWPLVWLYGPPR